MKLEHNTLFRYTLESGVDRGLCKLWVCKGRDGAAVVVITRLPGDPCPVPLGESIHEVCNQIRHTIDGLDSRRTKWFLRSLGSAKHGQKPREHWSEYDYSIGLEGVLYDPESTPSTRSSAEILSGVALPEPSIDEYLIV